MDHGLGRCLAIDELDRGFPLQALLSLVEPARLELTSRYWNAQGWWGDQGQTSECVAYAWTHWLEDGPVTHSGPAPMVLPNDIYNQARRVDEWDGEGYDGTSVRAGVKVLQTLGLVDSYWWATTAEEIAHTVLTSGPVVVGTEWSESMFSPNASGLVKFDPLSIVGGHAWLINGYNVKRKMFRAKNSWGREWGKKGYFSISFDDIQILMQRDGEGCLAIENK